MAYGTVRCAACGSKNVMVDSEQSRFSTKKAVIGTATIGVLGAAAGFIGDKKAVYKCKDCGMELSYCMDDATVTKVEYAIMMGSLDDGWKALKEKYKNIEARNAGVYPMLDTSASVEQIAEKFIRNYIAEMQRRWTPEIVNAMSATYDKETRAIERHKAKLEKFESEHNFAATEKRLKNNVKALNNEVKNLSRETERLKKELKAKEAELENGGLFALMRKKKLEAEISVARAQAEKADENQKLADQKHKEAERLLSEFQADRIAEYEKAGLSLELPSRSIVTNPRDIGAAYAGTSRLLESGDSLLAFDVYTKLILYLAQCDLYTYEVAKVSKKICDRLGFTGLEEYDPGISEFNSRTNQIAIASATDELITLARYGKALRFSTPQYPGHKKVPIYPEMSQNAKDNPYLITPYEITEEGKAFLNSDLLYTTFVDNRYGFITRKLFQFGMLTKLRLPAPVKKMPEEPMAVTEQTEKQDMTTQRAELKKAQPVDNSRCPNRTSADVHEIPEREGIPSKVVSAAPAISPMDELKKLKELLDLGIVTQEEFDAKKKQLLGL